MPLSSRVPCNAPVGRFVSRSLLRPRVGCRGHPATDPALRFDGAILFSEILVIPLRKVRKGHLLRLKPLVSDVSSKDEHRALFNFAALDRFVTSSLDGHAIIVSHCTLLATTKFSPREPKRADWTPVRSRFKSTPAPRNSIVASRFCPSADAARSFSAAILGTKFWT